jgi:glycosyltransferase involved in cell wall biosynthesis
MSEFPTLLILVDDGISPGHGTGAVLLRHFADYPKEKLFHAFHHLKGDPFLPQSQQVRVGQAASADDNELPTVAEYIQGLRAKGVKIDLIYSNVFGERGLTMLGEFIEHWGSPVPVIQHFHDILFDDKERFAAQVKALAPRVNEFWAIGEAIRQEIAAIIQRDVVLMNTFLCEIKPTWKTDHREFGPDFTAVMLGNSHMPWVMDGFRKVWARIRADFPGLAPIKWLGYPTSVLYVQKAGVVFEPDIEYYGYLNDRVLHEHLCAADVALVPFNIADIPEYHYARYSIPSRLTEFLNAGLPIFAAAGRQTDTYTYITQNRIGMCATLADEDDFYRKLSGFLRKKMVREQLGKQARAFAEQNCDVRIYREKLFGRIRQLCAASSR